MTPLLRLSTLRHRYSQSGHGLLERIERRFGITSKGVAVLTVAALGLYLGRVGRSRSMLLLVYGALLVVAAAWLLGNRRLAADAHRSSLPSRARVGQRIEVDLAVHAKRGISTVVLEEEIHHHLGSRVRIAVPSLGAGEELKHGYVFTPRFRGVYEVGPLMAEKSDAFGLTRRRTVVAPATKIIIHPRVETVHDRVLSREWEDPPVRPPVSKPWPTGFEFYGMRDYVSGDDPRRIIWRATAKTLDGEGGGRYLVKESEQGITDRVNIYVDTGVEFHSPGEPSDTFELAVRAVASLAVRHLGDGFSVDIEGNSGTIIGGLRGERNRIPMLDAMTTLAREDVPFTKALDRLLVSQRPNAHNVIVTPHLEPEAFKRLRLLRERGASMLLVLVMWESTEPEVLHRAGSIGCGVVEVTSNSPLDLVFQKMLVGGRR